MICPQCGKHYVEDESECRLCAVPLLAPPASVPVAEEPGPVRPPGIDQTLKNIRQDIDTIDKRIVKPAGFFIRLLASCIDSLILTLLTLAVSAAAFMLLKQSGTQISFETDAIIKWVWLLFFLPNMLLTAMYFTYFHAVPGQTVGKLVCGVQVVTAVGNKPLGWLRSIVRCIGYFLCSFLLCIGFVWVLFNRRKRGWHDYLAGSMVIYKGD